MSKARILLNLFHPHLEHSRGNRILSDKVKELPHLTFRNLYQIYPDFKINVKEEQRLLLEHDLIVFQHPLYWYSGPALLKEWQDRVLEYGFAYPPGIGTQLNGKFWLSVITTGGPQESYRSGGYNNYTISELLRPFQQAAILCGMIWRPPFVTHSVLPPGIEGLKSMSDQEISNRAAAYRTLLEEFSLG